MKSINKFLIDKGYHSNNERITILEMVKLVDEWQANEIIFAEAENKALKEALKAIDAVTKDETLPLFRVINQIAAKSLKAIK